MVEDGYLGRARLECFDVYGAGEVLVLQANTDGGDYIGFYDINTFDELTVWYDGLGRGGHKQRIEKVPDSIREEDFEGDMDSTEINSVFF